LIRKFHEAKLNNQDSVEIWGTGKPRREFMYVDDLAEACFFLMENFDEPGFINMVVGEDITIYNLAKLIQEIVGFRGELKLDISKPDGTPRKLMDVSRLEKSGFKAKISLKKGISSVYQIYKSRNQ
jgi:GDP-L-fucose synthase